MKMKFTMSLVGFSAALLAGLVCVTMSQLKQKPIYLLENIEALAGDEYHQGQPGTNWKTYTITCVAYGESSDNWYFKSGSYVNVNGVEVGVDYEIGGGGSSSYEPFEFSKDVCGYGAGLCLTSAPSGHPCRG